MRLLSGVESFHYQMREAREETGVNVKVAECIASVGVSAEEAKKEQESRREMEGGLKTTS